MRYLRYALLGLLALAALLLSSPEQASGVTDGYPDSMASLGDSITRAVNPEFFLLGDQPQYSWSTGDNSAVQSHYYRILQKNSAISGNSYNDAVSGAKMIDRTDVDLPSHPDVKWVFPDPRAEGVRYYEKTGIYPINHAMVMRRSVAQAHPWAVTNIYKAMVQANALADAQRMEHVAYFLDAGLLPPEAGAVLESPLVEYGIAANREILELADRYSHDQGLTPREMPLDEIFAASTLDE